MTNLSRWIELYPNRTQGVLLQKYLGFSRSISNLYIDFAKECYKYGVSDIPYDEFMERSVRPYLKENEKWIGKYDYTMIPGIIYHMDTVIKNTDDVLHMKPYDKKNMEEEFLYIQFRSTDDRMYTLTREKNEIVLPYFGTMKYKDTKKFPDNIVPDGFLLCFDKKPDAKGRPSNKLYAQVKEKPVSQKEKDEFLKEVQVKMEAFLISIRGKNKNPNANNTKKIQRAREREKKRLAEENNLPKEEKIDHKKTYDKKPNTRPIEKHIEKKSPVDIVEEPITEPVEKPVEEKKEEPKKKIKMIREFTTTKKKKGKKKNKKK